MVNLMVSNYSILLCLIEMKITQVVKSTSAMVRNRMDGESQEINYEDFFLPIIAILFIGSCATTVGFEKNLGQLEGIPINNSKLKTDFHIEDISDGVWREFADKNFCILK